MTDPAFDPATAGLYWSKARRRYQVSRQLLDLGYVEDAANRAYFAVFSAISLLHYLAGQAYSSHQQVLGMFNKNFVHPGSITKTVARTISDLFYLRHKADYDFLQGIDEELARRSILDAASVFNEVEAFIATHYPEVSLESTSSGL